MLPGISFEWAALFAVRQKRAKGFVSAAGQNSFIKTGRNVV
jgi:hypothetical protein